MGETALPGFPASSPKPCLYLEVPFVQVFTESKDTIATQPQFFSVFEKLGKSSFSGVHEVSAGP